MNRFGARDSESKANFFPLQVAFGHNIHIAYELRHDQIARCYRRRALFFSKLSRWKNGIAKIAVVAAADLAGGRLCLKTYLPEGGIFPTTCFTRSYNTGLTGICSCSVDAFLSCIAMY